NILFHPHLTSTDLCACTVTLNGTRLDLCSVYIPPEGESVGGNIPIGTYLNKIHLALQSLSSKVFIGGDFNGHHMLWGSRRSSPRGEEICNFAATSDLHLLNQGDEPTFLRA